jgi:hypothetical protein
MSSSEYEAAIAFMKEFHSRRVTTRPSLEVPRFGGALSSIMEARRIDEYHDTGVWKNNRIVRARTTKCLVKLERGLEH